MVSHSLKILTHIFGSPFLSPILLEDVWGVPLDYRKFALKSSPILIETAVWAHQKLSGIVSNRYNRNVSYAKSTANIVCDVAVFCSLMITFQFPKL